MAVMVMTCPHCASERMTFRVGAVVPHRDDGYKAVLAMCSKCDRPVVCDFYDTSGQPADSLFRFQGDLGQVQSMGMIGIWPTPVAIDAPADLPDRVLRAYMDAANARRIGLWTPACGAYRRCMELALKQFAPEVEAWKLEKRIDRLAAENRITPDLQAWAHELRLDGNDALHAEEESTQEVTDQMHHLTYFLLTYLYTLPKQVEQARERRAEGEAA